MEEDGQPRGGRRGFAWLTRPPAMGPAASPHTVHEGAQSTPDPSILCWGPALQTAVGGGVHLISLLTLSWEEHLPPPRGNPMAGMPPIMATTALTPEGDRHLQPIRTRSWAPPTHQAQRKFPICPSPHSYPATAFHPSQEQVWSPRCSNLDP